MVCGPRMCLILSAIGACEGPAESGPKFSKQSSTGVSTSDMGVWSSTISVGPWVTEVVGRSCRNPALQLLVVPGNPGLSTFYNAFMECLVKRFGPDKVDVMAVSHAGHDSANLSQGQVWCLDSQISHKVQLLKEHILLPGRPPTVVIAHSIGSYIMLQAIKKLEEEAHAAGAVPRQQLPKVILLMPFLAADWSSSRQRVLRFCANNLAPVLGAVAGAVGRLPGWLQDRLVQLVQPGAEQHARESIKALMTSTGVHNNFHLAQHEFRDLDRPADFQLIQRLGNRAAVVCAPQDMWFPAQHYQQMRSALPEVEEYWCHQLTHAFCMERRQCEFVARLVYQSIVSSMPHLLVSFIPSAAKGIAAAEEAAAEAAAPLAAAETRQGYSDQQAADMAVVFEDSGEAQQKVLAAAR